uniref:CCDC113/CCDC96 coiled-coil domain-containing protein n=1 Tax=Electrophorus electricus TaxID=8005 RepID=A0AAY5ETW5_ELEEL
MRHSTAEDKVDVTVETPVETTDRQAAGEGLVVATGDDGMARTEMPTSTITTTLLEDEGKSGVNVEEEEVEEGPLQPTADQLEVEQTTADQPEVEQTTLEAEQMKPLHDLQAERDKLSLRNSQLLLQLLHHICRKAPNEPHALHGTTDISELEQRYLKLLDTVENLARQHCSDSELHLQQAIDLHQQSQEKVEQVEREWKAWAEARCEATVATLSRTLGRRTALAQAERLGEAMQKGEDDLGINLTLDEGINLIDFEQLKIENHTYSKKIEERDEELLKLRKKISSTLQVLSHVKEKLQFVQVENQAKRDRLVQAQVVVDQGRDILTRTKQARDALRADNLRLRRRCSLLGNATLLRDFEEKVDAYKVLEEQLEMLKRRHAELSVRGAGVKRIRQMR